MLSIPLLLLGSFALVISNFPIAAYQTWLNELFSGYARVLLDGIYKVTFDSLALILILTIGYSYGQGVTTSDYYIFYPLTALCCFLVFVFPSHSEDVFGPEWVFTALCITLSSCWILRKGRQLFNRVEQLYTIGAEQHFNIAIQALAPVVFTVLVYGVLGIAVDALWGGSEILNFGSYLFYNLFEHMGNNLGSTLLYIFFTHALWFLGIHGTNTLEAVSRKLFESEIQINQDMLAQGLVPDHIFSKTFIDTFVFIGGCGAACCLMLALFIAARKRYNRRLAKFSSIPILFNISEIAVFGFPIIFNPIMVIPFILTPIVLALISSGAMSLGLVPVATHSVEWTVPLFFSGYTATGSIAGALLQAVNLAVGTLIYVPFIRYNEKRQTQRFRENVKKLEDNMREKEQVIINNAPAWDGPTNRRTAKVLANDLFHAMKQDELELYFQPQIDKDGRLYGAEALLRWNYLKEGYIYPPLIIALASQGGFMDEMGLHILERACRYQKEIRERTGQDITISVNVLPSQLQSGTFAGSVADLLRETGMDGGKLTLEFTEQVALNVSRTLEEQLRALRESGIRISMDDFGMGHGSMGYLNNNLFDEVKIDGSLVQQLLDNGRVRDIIASILGLADNLYFNVVAECVETTDQRDALIDLGCGVFQGYLFSPPLPIDQFCAWLQSLDQ